MEEKFDLYLERYCDCYHVSPEEASKHKTVQDVKDYYEEEKKDGRV